MSLYVHVNFEMKVEIVTRRNVGVPCGGHTGVQYPTFVSLRQRLAISCVCCTNTDSVDKMAVEDCR